MQNSSELENGSGLAKARLHYRSHFGNTFSNQCARFLLGKMDINKGESFLDVATGPGTAIFEAICTFDELPSFVGVDASLEMLHGAESILEGIWDDVPLNIEFLHEDVHQLSFADEMFDGIFSNLGIHLFSSRERAIGEMRRVLKPDGSLTLTIPYLIPESYPFATSSAFGNEDGELVTGAMELSALSGKQYTIIREIEDELESAGFKNIETADAEVPYACSGGQEVIGLLKTVLHFSGRLSAPDRVRAFALLDGLQYAAPVWGDVNTYAVNLGVARISGVKKEN
jgi:ubiquinone/menaquinone biosynthesis C-methylase UbiE